MKGWKKEFNRGEMMTEDVIMILTNGFTLLLILSIQLLLPNVSRRNILLGVKISRDKMREERVKKIIGGFRGENIVVGIMGMVINFSTI